MATLNHFASDHNTSLDKVTEYHQLIARLDIVCVYYITIDPICEMIPGYVINIDT